MSLHRTEREKENAFDDSRRVSFSLPRSKKLDKTNESTEEDSDSLSDVVPPPVEVKPKKKWKIKLPWKQKKQLAYYDSPEDEIIEKNDEIDLVDELKKLDSLDKEDKFDDREDASPSPSASPPLSVSPPPSASPPPRKEDRPLTWYGGFQMAGPSADSSLENRSNSIQIPKDETKSDRGKDVHSVQTTVAEFHADDVDFVSDSSSFNKNKKQKAKPTKFRLNFKAFNQKTYAYDNSNIKIREETEKDLSSTEAFSPDINSPLSEGHLSKSNSSLIDIEDQKDDKVKSDEMLSERKIPEDHFIKSRIGPINTTEYHKKSSSLPRIFKKYKKKKETDFKTSQLRKYHHENWDKKSPDSSAADLRKEKSNAAAEDVLPSMSDSELHSINEYQRERSGSQPNIHSSKRRTHRSIFKMSRSSFIANSNTSKSSDLLNRSMSSDNNDRQEIVPKTNDQNSRSLDDLDIQNETNSDFQLKSSFSRNYRAKNSQRNTFSNLSTGDLGSNHSDKQTVSKEKVFDQNFKSDYAVKMNQVSIRNQKSTPIIKPQRHKSPVFSNSDVASPEILEKGVISQKKSSVDQSLKVDDFTNFIKSYSTNNPAKTKHASKKEKSENLSDRNADAPEFIEKETVLLKRDGDQPFKTVGDSTKPRKKLKSSSKTNPPKNDPRKNSSEHSSSDAVLDHSDKDKKIRKVKTGESSVEPNEFTEFIKNYNSSKSSKILIKSHKHHQHKKNVGKEPLNSSNIINNGESKKMSEEIVEKPSSGIISKTDFQKSDSSDEGNLKVSLPEFRGNKNALLKEKSNKEVDRFTDFKLITNSGKNVKSEQSAKEIKSFTDNINSLSVPISDSIVRRRSYEEMTNLLEEQMFASDSEEASDTDSDEVDLSFGRKKVESKLKEEDFKLCVVTEQGSFSGTELVYEPKILPKKESSLPSSKSEIINTSPILKRPSDAPPLPPQIIGKESMTNINSLEPKLSDEVTLTKSDYEKSKRKKLRKTPTTRSMSNSTDSDTSIEDGNGTLYASFSSKLDYKRENILKKEHNLLSKLSVKAHTNNISDTDDDDFPPILSPLVHYSGNNENPQIIRDANKEYLVNEGLAETVHNKLGSTSATGVAKGLYTRREDRNNSLFNWSDANVVDVHFKGKKPLRPLMKPPSPPSSPPPDDLFSPDPIPIGGSYNLKNFSPKYEYAPNMPSLGLPVNNKRQPISCYSSYRDEINATNENSWKEEDKFDSFDDVGKNSHSFHKQEVNSDFKYVQNQFSNNEHKICNEKSNLESSSSFVPESLQSGSIHDMKNTYLEGYNKISQSTSFQNDINTSKKHIVTFSLPSPTNIHPDYKTPSNSATSYRDISYGEKNNPIPVAQNDKISYHSLPNNLQAYRVNGMPKSSFMIQRQMLSAKEDASRVSQEEEGIKEDLLIVSQLEEGMPRLPQTEEGRSSSNCESNMSHEERFQPSNQKINSNPYQAYDSNTYPYGSDRSHERPYPYGIDRSHGRYIHVSSPIPYSKEGRQLKSILKSNCRNNDIGHSTQPSLLQTNIKYIQPVSGEVKSNVYRTVSKQLIPSTATRTAAFNPAIERVKIVEETSSSESEISPPALPSYPPPLPRQTWHHQQQFLGGLLHTDRDLSSSAVQPQQPPHHSSYYTPTIIEVEAHQGRMLERESVYQNVIHASQV